MTFDGFEWLIVLYLPAVFYMNWRSDDGKRFNNMRHSFSDRVRNRLAKWKDLLMVNLNGLGPKPKQDIEYNDPKIIQAVYQHDPTLAMIIERWEDFTWLQRKEIYWKTWRAYQRSRIDELWRRICSFFVYS